MPELGPINPTWRITFAALTLAFNAAVLWWLLLYGSEDNSLHQSALSWTATISAGVLAGIGFGAIADLIPNMLGGDKK